MNGEPKKLKDQDGIYILPVTHSDLVYVEPNKTLTQRLTEGGTGKSAYQTWIDLGNTGTEQDFLNSLKGAKGDPGTASLAINDSVTNTATSWSGSKINSMIFQAKTLDSAITKAADITTSGIYRLLPSRLSDIPPEILTRQTLLTANINTDSSKMFIIQEIQADNQDQSTYVGYKHYQGTSVYWHRIQTNRDRQFVDKRMVLLGDSIMTMVDKYAMEKRTGFSIDNLALGGSSVALRSNINMAPTWDPKALVTISKTGTENSIPIENYDYGMIFIGTNDWGNSHPLGTIDGTDELTILGAYNVAIQNLLTRKPDLKLLIATPMYRNGGEITAGGYPKLSEVGKGIESLAKKYSIPVLNMMEKGMISDFNKSVFLVSDLLHPNEVGKPMITNKFISFILNSY